jgi:PAS domain S-box-containing protein
MVADDPLQVEELERLRVEHAAWERLAGDGIRARTPGEGYRVSLSELFPRVRLFGEMRTRIATFLQHQEDLRRTRIAAAQRRTREGFIVATVVLSIATLSMALYVRRRVLMASDAYRRATDAEARLRRLWESNIIGVVHAGTDGSIYDANDAYLRMIGYTREDLDAGRLRWDEITLPEYAPVDEQCILGALERGACDPYEKVYIHKDGRLVPVLLGYAMLEGSAEESICVVLDLTEQKRAQREAAEQHELVRTIADNAAAALFTEDERGNCTYMNPAAEAMTGFSFAELQGRNLHDAIHHQQPDGSPLPAAECSLHPARMGETRIGRHEVSLIKKSGERFSAICAAAPVVRDGRHVATVIEGYDVTEQKRSEREREQLLDSERAARGAAERALRVKDEFLAVLSHELRTPLNAVLGWTGMLRKGKLDPGTAARAIEVVERNARAEAQLIEELLDVSRIAAGKLRLEVQEVHPAEVVASTVDSVRPAAEAKRIHLTTVLAPGLGPVSGDPGRLAQIVWNLLSNAIKFTPKGGRVSVSLDRMGSSVEISVSDTGQGIRADFLPYVFERFRQADSSTTRHHGGLGLGLSLVKSLVELHRGTVRAESEGEGRGATFVVSLPIAAVRRPEDEEATPGAWESLRGIRVLVVDDEEDTRELVRRLLADCEAEVVAVETAHEALEEVQRFRPDVLLSDIGMPQQDGYQLVRALRALGDENGGATPAAALTAFARPEDRQRALRAGFQMHVTKPVDANELISVVRSLARRVEGQRVIEGATS